MFLHLVVVRSACRYLWQVCYAYYLSAAVAHVLHYVCHLFGYLAADASVYLVEYYGRQFYGSADESLQRQHQSGYLATRSHLCHRPESHALVGREEEGYLVLS